MLTVLSMTNKQKQKSTVWIVKCDCGIQKEMSSGNLRISRSCGCQSLRALKDSREKNMLHLEGKVFGKLTVISFSRIAPVGRKGATTTKWNCHCECGSDLEVFGNALSMGVTSSCGCSLRMYLSIGKKFGRWTTLSLVPVKNEYRGPTSYICKCECGTVRKVPAERLQSGRSLSCGCLVADLQKERALKKRQDDPAYDQKRLHRRHLWQCSPAVRFKKAIDEAKRRKIPWNMEQEEYVPFILKPCYYCGASLEDESGAGLDRINNDRTIGYRVSNVLSCCGPCNWARGDRYTSEEFKVMMDALLEYRNDQKNNHR